MWRPHQESAQFDRIDKYVSLKPFFTGERHESRQACVGRNCCRRGSSHHRIRCVLPIRDARTRYHDHIAGPAGHTGRTCANAGPASRDTAGPAGAPAIDSPASHTGTTGNDDPVTNAACHAAVTLEGNRRVRANDNA
jgi:hypothetical protein